MFARLTSVFIALIAVIGAVDACQTVCCGYPMQVGRSFVSC